MFLPKVDFNNSAGSGDPMPKTSNFDAIAQRMAVAENYWRFSQFVPFFKGTNFPVLLHRWIWPNCTKFWKDRVPTSTYQTRYFTVDILLIFAIRATQKQVAQLSQRDRAIQGGLVMAKSGRLQEKYNILRKL